MKLKPLIITTSVLAVGAVATFFATRPPRLTPDDPREGKPLVATDILENASHVTVRANDQTTDLVRQPDGGWTIPSFFDLPIDFSRLQTLTDSLANAKVQDLVTRRPERIARLDLEKSSVALSDGKGKEWKLFVGKTSDAGGRFVRFGDEQAAFTSDFNGWLDGTPKNWADTALLSLKPEEIKAINVSLPAGGEIALQREKAEADFTAAGLPAGHMLAKAKVTSLLSTLGSIRFSEALPAGDPGVAAAKGHDRRVIVDTFDGRKFTITFSRAPAPPAPSPVPSATPAPPKENPVYVRVESADANAPLNRIMTKAAFQIYPYAYDNLPKDWSALTEAAAQPTPAPTPTPAPASAPSKAPQVGQ